MEGVPAAKDYKGGFACKLMSKDLGLAAAAAQHCGAKVPMSQEAAKLYQQVQHKSAILGHQQCSPVCKPYGNRLCQLHDLAWFPIVYLALASKHAMCIVVYCMIST